MFSRDAEEQGQIDACKELGVAMMAYAMLGRGMLSAQGPKVEELAADDIRPVASLHWRWPDGGGRATLTIVVELTPVLQRTLTTSL